jgi:hypothetical protein
MYETSNRKNTNNREHQHVVEPTTKHTKIIDSMRKIALLPSTPDKELFGGYDYATYLSMMDEIRAASRSPGVRQGGLVSYMYIAMMTKNYPGAKDHFSSDECTDAADKPRTRLYQQLLENRMCSIIKGPC